MFTSFNLSKIIAILVVILFIGGIIHIISPSFKESPVVQNVIQTLDTKIDIKNDTPLPYVRTGKYVVVHLDQMTLELHDGSTTVATMPIVAQGPQGKYYETIGGEYVNDYKIRNHFSSIGHVYMPYSVHVFGNFFIHGIPYYEGGEKVSSEYSGGCIRIGDEDAKTVYEFIEKGTPIIITRGGENDFLPTATSSDKIEDMTMTRQMVAIVSLEVLPQDNDILDTDRVTVTTRRRLIPRLLLKEDDDVSKIYTYALGEPTYVDYMNQKAKTMGLTNTVFTKVGTPATTTKEDQDRFNKYISIYKSYLLQFTPSI